MNKLNSAQRSYLTKLSHEIKPVMYVGQNGLTDGVAKGVQDALIHNELVKVKFVSNKELKGEISREIETFTNSNLVRIIGNISIFYKPFEKKDQRVIFLPR